MKTQCFEPKLALVTGASAGIGRAFAHELASRGVGLVLVARRQDALEALATQLRTDFHVQAHCESVDLSVAGEAMRLIERCQSRGLEVDLLVNNAGAAVATEQQLEAPWKVASVLQLNIVTAVELSLAFGAQMKRRGRGAVLNVGSMTAYLGAPSLRTYGPAKRFLQAFSDELREELAPAGVSVTTLVPGLTSTDWFEHAGVPFDAAAARKIGMMEPADVARIGVDAALAGAQTVIAGALNRWMAFAAQHLPGWIVRALVTRGRARLHPRAQPRRFSSSFFASGR